LTAVEKRYLVLDTCVLASIQNWPTHLERAREIMMAAELLSKIYAECHCVVIDQEGEILEEYNRHIGADDFLRKWWIATSSLTGKLTTRPRAQITLGIHLDPDDQKFLEVVLNTPHRTIVTDNSDFLTIRDHQKIRDLGVRILSVEEALHQL